MQASLINKNLKFIAVIVREFKKYKKLIFHH